MNCVNKAKRVDKNRSVRVKSWTAIHMEALLLLRSQLDSRSVPMALKFRYHSVSDAYSSFVFDQRAPFVLLGYPFYYKNVVQPSQ